MKLVSVKQMVRLEEEANKGGLSYKEMMARAGKGLAEVVHHEFFDRPGQPVLGLVGSGNNGGDALVALTQLIKKGWDASAYLAKEREKDDPLVSEFLESGGRVIQHKKDKGFEILASQVKNSNFVLDGILGTGIKLPLKGDIPAILRAVKDVKPMPKIVAVDCPSGIDCDTGDAADECIPADITVCMAAVKDGLLRFPALGLVGEIRTVDIGLQPNLKGWKDVEGEVVGREDAARLLPGRPKDSHKGTFGTVLIAAGSINYPGAVLLSAESAYKAGAGLVRAAVPGAIYEGLPGALPECTWIILPHAQGVIHSDAADVLLKYIESVQAMVLGMGWGQEDETLRFLEALLEIREGKKQRRKKLGFEEAESERAADSITFPPLAIDADGLRLLSKIADWEKKLPGHSIMTPHPGEMAALTGMDIDEIQKDRIGTARKFSEKWNQVVMLKGAGTVVADPSGKFAVIPIATPALATAGTGDVLAGMIGGMLAQGLQPYHAAVLSSWLHAMAGRITAKNLATDRCATASDVIQALPEAFKQISGIT